MTNVSGTKWDSFFHAPVLYKTVLSLLLWQNKMAAWVIQFKSNSWPSEPWSSHFESEQLENDQVCFIDIQPSFLGVLPQDLVFQLSWASSKCQGVNEEFTGNFIFSLIWCKALMWWLAFITTVSFCATALIWVCRVQANILRDKKVWCIKCKFFGNVFKKYFKNVQNIYLNSCSLMSLTIEFIYEELLFQIFHCLHITPFHIYGLFDVCMQHISIGSWRPEALI